MNKSILGKMKSVLTILLIALSASLSQAFEATSTNFDQISTDEDDDSDFEFNGVSQEYETVDLFFFQSFFENLSANFIPPLVGNLTYFTLPDIDGSLPLFDQEFTIDYTLMGLRIASASIDSQPPLIQIGDGDFTMAVSNLTFNLTSDYKLMSEPPILADIGEANLCFANTSLSSDVSTYLHNTDTTSSTSRFTVELSNMHIESQPKPFASLDGINDFSQIATNVLNTVAAVVRNRVESFVNGGDQYGVDEKIEAVVNAVFAYAAMPWILPGDKGLYIDGFFYDNIQSLNDQLVFKLDTQLRQN